jgi:LAGLIDADG endonuclease
MATALKSCTRCRHYFGCGSLRPNQRDKTLKWEVRNLSLLWERVVPHFRRYPLLSGKRLDFDLFERVCASMIEERHLSMEGLVEIVRMAARMNPSGTRRYRPDAILEALEMKA